ncbi:MAG: hypothetical protein PHT92_11815 [Bacteroidales bacterium]|nr:hypothetical protein [Bacteroidales bacterium]
MATKADNHMQIAEFISSQETLYYPITAAGLRQRCAKSIKSAARLLAHEIIDMPQIYNNELKTNWEKHFADFEQQNENEMFCSIEFKKFFEAYNKPQWLVISLKTKTLACGLAENSVWFVFDMETQGPLPDGYTWPGEEVVYRKFGYCS